MSTPVQLHSLVDGRWREGTGDILTSTNPAQPEIVVAQGRLAGTNELDDAVLAAERTKQEWSRTPAHERGAILIRAAAILEDNAETWGTELTQEEGKTRPEGIAEVLRAAQVLCYYGNEGDRDAGELFSSPRRSERILVTRRAVGVIGVVTPFNFPIAIPAWKIAPALTFGNTVVWKPASTVPLLALRLAQALTDAGLPHGVLNLLVGDRSVGNGIIEHPGIDAITFTGSTTVGRRIASSAAARGVPVQAEMGGKNAAIVLGDADLDLAAEQVMSGAFLSSGQRCTATSRLIVTNDIANDFLAELGKRADKLRVGDPIDDEIDMGPVVDANARRSINDGIGRAFDQGARTIAGGVRYTEGPLASGYFAPPTILELSSRSSDLWREELFGPVLAVSRAASVDEAFAMANDSEFGLSAAVFTQDLTRTLEAIDDIDVGVLHINSESAGADPHVPFGGAKKSAYGPKEQGRAAREFFTHTTTVYLRGGRAGI